MFFFVLILTKDMSSSSGQRMYLTVLAKMINDTGNWHGSVLSGLTKVNVELFSRVLKYLYKVTSAALFMTEREREIDTLCKP